MGDTSLYECAVREALATSGLGAGHCTFQVTADFDPRAGIGSSSALVLAIFCLCTRCGPKLRAEGGGVLGCGTERLQMSARMAGGKGSGYDVATQLLGGLVAFTPDPEFLARYLYALTLRAALAKSTHRFFTGGKGAPTAELLEAAQTKWKSDPDIQAALIQSQIQLVEAFADAPTQADLNALVRAAAQARRSMAQMPGFPVTIVEELTKLQGFDATWTVKTTGAGGEDALLFIGPPLRTANRSGSVGKTGMGATFCRTFCSRPKCRGRIAS